MSFFVRVSVFEKVDFDVCDLMYVKTEEIFAKYAVDANQLG